MKIVAIDNFDRDWVPEHVKEENLTQLEAKARCDALNRASHCNSEWYYVVRADDAPVRTLDSIT
jgi:hypothetical protein